MCVIDVLNLLPRYVYSVHDFPQLLSAFLFQLSGQGHVAAGKVYN
jgi:hypothetical protein